MKRDQMRVATLNWEENHSWEFAFTFYLADGYSEDKADDKAWRDLTAEFPRLKEFHGCR